MAGPSIKSEEGKKKARIEIIPLIDVIFFLLATFVLFTLSLDRTVSVPVQLPKASNNPGQPDPELVTLQMSGGSNAYWKMGQGGAELITTLELESRLKAYKNQHPTDAKVLVTGDQQSKFGAEVLALDLVRKVGIAQVSIETQPRATGK